MKSSAIKMARQAAQALLEKKAQEVVILKVQNLTPMFDYFVIATANSRVHAQALAQNLLETFKRKKIFARHSHGLEYGAWVLLDFGSLVVHIFLSQLREFYDLESAWAKAKIMPLEPEKKKPK